MNCAIQRGIKYRGFGGITQGMTRINELKLLALKKKEEEDKLRKKEPYCNNCYYFGIDSMNGDVGFFTPNYVHTEFYCCQKFNISIKPPFEEGKRCTFIKPEEYKERALKGLLTNKSVEYKIVANVALTDGKLLLNCPYCSGSIDVSSDKVEGNTYQCLYYKNTIIIPEKILGLL